MFTLGRCPICNKVTLHERRDYRGERFCIFEARKVFFGQRPPYPVVRVPVAVCTICNSANEFGAKGKEVISYGIRYVDSLRDGLPKLPTPVSAEVWSGRCEGVVRTIPALLHAYWCGPRFPDEHVEALTRWVTLNRHVGLQAVLWTEDRDLKALVLALKATEIHVKSVASIDDSAALLSAIESEANPVARSDVLRQLVLLRFGGIYVDCGTRPSGKLPSKMAFVFHPGAAILAGKTHYIENRVIVMDNTCPGARKIAERYLEASTRYYSQSRTVATLYDESLKYKETQLIPLSRKALLKSDAFSEILQLASYFLDRDSSGDHI